MYVGNITASITEETLLALFAHCGQVTNVRISGYVLRPRTVFDSPRFCRSAESLSRTRLEAAHASWEQPLARLLLLHPQ